MTSPIGNQQPVRTGPLQGQGVHQNAPVQGQQQAAPAPRSLLTRIGEAIQQAFGLGVGGSARSPEARAQAQITHATQSVATAFNLPNPKTGSAEKAAAAVMELQRAAQAVSVASQGRISPDEAFGQAVDATLGTLSADALANMSRAFKSNVFANMLQSQLAKDPQAERYSMMLEQKVKSALTGQVMSNTQAKLSQEVNTALSLVKGQDPQGLGMAALALVRGLGNADAALANWASDAGSGLSHKELQALNTEMAHTALAALTPDERDAVLQAAPSEVLARLASSHADKGIHAAAVRTIAERTDMLTAQALSVVEPLLARDLGDKALALTPQNAEAFAKEMEALAAGVHALRLHAKDTGQAFPPAVDEALAKLLGPLEDRLQATKANLPALTDAQFSTLREALRTLGVPDSAKALATDAERRLAPGLVQLQTQLGATFTALVSGQPGPMLSAADALNQVMTQAIDQRKTVLNDLQGAPEIFRLRNAQILQAMANLPENQLFDLFAQLQSPRFAALQEGLYAAMDAANTGGRDDLGQQMGNMAVILDELKGQVLDAMEARSVTLPRDPDTGRLIMPSSDERFSAKGLDEGLRDAIRAQFGVAIDVQGRAILQSGTLRGGALNTLAQLVELPASQSGTLKTLPNGLQITTQMYVDLARSAGLNVVGGQGLDRSNWNTIDTATQDARIEAVGQELLALVGNDQAKLVTLTSLVHQGMASGFQAVLMSPDNPIRLPNGEAIVPMRANNLGQETLSFTVRRDDTTGDIYVRLDASLQNAGTAMRADGSMLYLNPNTSYQANSYEARVDFATGKLVVTSPASFRYNVEVQADWQKPYPMPSSLTDPSLQDLNNLLANSEAVSDMDAFMANRFNAENLRAVKAMEAFANAPTLQAAEALQAEFLAANAPQQVNTTQSLLNPVQNAITTARATRNTALDAAFTVIEQDLIGETDIALYGPLLNRGGLTSLPGWPTGFAAPASYPALLASGNQAAINAFHAWSDHPTRTPENGAFRQALADFRAAPSEAKAQAMFQNFIQSAVGGGINANQTMALNLSSDQVKAFAAVLNAPTPMAGNLFDNLRSDLMPLLKEEVKAFTLSVQAESRQTT